MPTGYTNFIDTGKITTGKEFLKLCIRAFGCCAEQRDDPLSAPLITEYKPDPYYRERYEESVEKLKKLEGVSLESIANDICSRKVKELETVEKSLKEAMETNRKYLKIKHDIDRWVPPTQDHAGIKEFALEQLKISMVDLDYYNRRRTELMTELMDEIDPEEEVRKLREDAQRDVEYYKEMMVKSEERSESRNKFIKEFLDSLEEV